MRATTDKTLWSLLALPLVIALAGTPLAADCAEDDDDDDLITDEIVLELRPGVSIDDVIERYPVTPLDGIAQFRMWKVLVAPGVDARVLAQAMEAGSPELVDEAEPHLVLDTPEGVQRSIPDLDYAITFNDFNSQPATETMHSDTTELQYTGSGVTIALLDTGVSFAHPQLAGRLQGPGADFAGGDGSAAAQPDGLDNDGDGDIDEGLHHATFVAGLISLVAPDAEIIPVRVLDAEGNGTAFGLAKGIQYAMQRGVDVINLSLSMSAESPVVDQAIDYAEELGIIVVAATGNRGVGCVDFRSRSAPWMTALSVPPSATTASISTSARPDRPCCRRSATASLPAGRARLSPRRWSPEPSRCCCKNTLD